MKASIQQAFDIIITWGATRILYPAVQGGWTFDKTRISTDAGIHWSVSPLSHGVKITVSSVPEPSTPYAALTTLTLIRFSEKKRKSLLLLMKQTKRSRE